MVDGTGVVLVHKPTNEVVLELAIQARQARSPRRYPRAETLTDIYHPLPFWHTVPGEPPAA